MELMGSPSWDFLLGPLGLTVFVLFLIWLFVTERVIPRGRLEDQKIATSAALDVVRGANLALEKMADALEARNRLDTEQLARLSRRGR